MVAIIVFLILLVAGLAVFRPEALAGNRPDNGLRAENQKIKRATSTSQSEKTLLREHHQVLAIIGRLAEDGKVVRDTSKGGHYYALKG
jgi:hypothetical protein